MHISAQVRWHISRLSDGELFATRDLLSYGPRDAIDKVIQRMIKQNVIVRLARGVFMKTLYVNGKLYLPQLVEIATTKASAFAKQIYTHGRDLAQLFNILPSGNPSPTFATSGCSSKFRCRSADFNKTTVHFKGTSPRYNKLGDTTAGQIIRALKHLKADSVDQSVWLKVMRSLNRPQRQEVKAFVNWMPKWVSDFYWIKCRCKPQVIPDDCFAWLRQHLGDDFASLGIKPFVPYWLG